MWIYDDSTSWISPKYGQQIKGRESCWAFMYYNWSPVIDFYWTLFSSYSQKAVSWNGNKCLLMPVKSEEGCSYICFKEHHVPLPTSTQWLKITNPRMRDDSAISPILEKRETIWEKYNHAIYHVKLWVVKLFKEMLECPRNDCRAVP